MNATLIGSANVDVTQNVFVATGIDIPTDYDWLLVEIAYGDRNKEYFTALVNYSDLNGLTVGKPDKPLARTAHLDIGEVAGSRVYLGKAYDNGFLLCVGGSGIDTLPLRVYGLEKASAEVGFLGPDADVNSLTDPGVYMRLSNSWSGSNNPFGTGGFVLYVSSEEGTTGQSNGHVRQTIRSFRQNQVYFVRETPDGDGTSTAVPSVITTGWLERDNYASYPEADVSNTIRVEAQQDVPSAVERDDLRASYGTSGTGGNAHYADSHPVRPLRESHWYPANYGVPADRNKVLQIYGTFGLHGKTISKLLIGKAGSVSEYDVTTTVSSAEGTTQIETTAGIPNLVSGGNTEIYYNLKFTDGSYLYSRVRAGSKTPVTLGREKMREWLDVPEVAASEGAIGLSTSEKLIPGKFFGTAADDDVAGSMATSENGKLPTVKLVKDYVTRQVSSSRSSVVHSENPSGGQAPLVKRNTNKLSDRIIPWSSIPSSALGSRVTNLEFLVFETFTTKRWRGNVNQTVVLARFGYGGGRSGTQLHYEPTSDIIITLGNTSCTVRRGTLPSDASIWVVIAGWYEA